MDSPNILTSRSSYKFNINLIAANGPARVETPSPEKPEVLPHFPLFRRTSFLKSPQLKSPKTNVDSPRSPAITPIPMLGLFPVDSSVRDLRSHNFGRVGIPSITPLPEKAIVLKSPAKRSKKAIRHLTLKELRAIETEGNIPKKSLKEYVEGPINNEDLLARNEPSHLAVLFRKIKTGRISIDHVDESDLIELAIEALKKPPDHRGTTEIAILVKCLGHVKFFKDHDPKTIENLVKVMHSVSLKAGEIVYNLDDVANNFWINLKGTVDISEYSEFSHDKRENENSSTQKVLKQIKMISAVSGFGELGMADQTLRIDSAICKEDCEFAVLDKGPFKEILQEKLTRKLNEKINFLAALPIFKGWTPRSVKDLFYQISIASYKRGNIVYDENDEAEKMYIIKRGEFKMVKEIELGEEPGVNANKLRKEQKVKKTIEVCLLGEREIFGENELLSSEKRGYRVVCESLDAEVFEIKRSILAKVLHHSQTKEWLEGYTKSKQKYFEDRIKLVKDATVKHKHLLIFNRNNSMPSTPHPLDEKRGSWTANSETSHLHAYPVADNFNSPHLNHERSQSLISLMHEKRFSNLGMQLAPEDPGIFSSKESKMDNHSSIGKKAQLALLIGSPGLLSYGSGEKSAIRTPDQYNQKSLPFDKVMTTRSGFYSPRVVQAKPFSSTTPFGEPLSTKSANTERILSKKSNVAPLNKKEERIITSRKSKEKSGQFYGKTIFNKPLEILTEGIDTPEKPKKERRHKKIKSFDVPINLLSLEDAQDNILYTKLSNTYKRFPTENDIHKDIIRKIQNNNIAFTQEGQGLLVYNNTISEAKTGRSINGRETVRMKDIEENKEKGFKKINWELQKQKVMAMVEKTASKEYRRFFYSLDGQDKLSTLDNKEMKLTIDGVIKEKEQKILKKGESSEYKKPGGRSERTLTDISRTLTSRKKLLV